MTVFGESGGGAKTTALLAMPAASGLFHKAFPMSGSMLAAKSRRASAFHRPKWPSSSLCLASISRNFRRSKWTDSLRQSLRCRDLGLVGAGSGRRFGPVLGSSLPRHPEEAIRLGAAASIPLVSGCTTDEMMAFLIGDPEFWSITEQGLRDRIGVFLGEKTEADHRWLSCAFDLRTPRRHF